MSSNQVLMHHVKLFLKRVSTTKPSDTIAPTDFVKGHYGKSMDFPPLLHILLEQNINSQNIFSNIEMALPFWLNTVWKNPEGGPKANLMNPYSYV